MVAGDPPIQSFYGIWDLAGNNVNQAPRIETLDRSELQEQEIIFEHVMEFTGPDGSINWPIRLVSKKSWRQLR
jgi:hypothetical protein